MAASRESLNTELFNTLKSRGYSPKPLNTKDKKTPVSEADVFAFNFVKNGKSYGPARISISDKNRLVVYTNEKLESSPSSKSQNSNFDDSWNKFKLFLKKWQQRKGMNGFELANDDRLVSDMEQRDYMKNKSNLHEGYYPVGKKASYSDSVPQVKILIQHTRQIEEGEQRYRNVARIFVENVNGERFLLPTKRPGIAKVYARHIAEGGTPYDDKGQHITSLVEEYTKMAGFVRATKNGQFNESTQRLVNEGINHYNNLRETLSRMISQRGYHKYFDSYTPVLNEETDDNTTINELFVQETLDPRIESVMPILVRLSKNINEMSEVKELDEWAEKLVNETLEGSGDIEEGKLAKAAMLGLAGMAALNPLAAKAGGVSLPGSGGEFSADQQVQLNKSTEAQMNAIQDLQKFLAKMGMRQVISGELDNVTYDNIMKASQMHDAGKMSGDQADMFKDLSTKAGLMKEGKLDEIGIGTLKSAEWNATVKAEKFKKEIERLEKLGDTANVEKYKKAMQYYLNLAKKTQAHPGKMSNIKIAKKMDAMMPSKLKNVAEGPADEPVEPDMDADDKRWDDVEEGLDANQKRVGQLGPTEPVGKNEKNLRGKLVGASESVEHDDLNRIKEIIGYK